MPFTSTARRTKSTLLALSFTLFFVTGGISAQTPSSFPVSVSVDASKSEGHLSRSWSYFGADEPNYATTKNGEALLQSLGELNPGHVYFRAHNLTTSGDGKPSLKWGSTNIYTEDANGRPIYDYTIIDGIFDSYKRHGLTPYVEIGFMPQALSSHSTPYFEGKFAEGLGVAYPPKDYEKWGDLVFNWVKHCVARYGKEEVESWYWEVWNEANIPGYWKGTPDQFWRLHDVAIQAVRRALPTARVGGPDMAGSGQFLADFMNYVNAFDVPTDFVSFHAKGSPKFINADGGKGFVRMNIAPQLNGIDAGFKIVAHDTVLSSAPIVIGENDPDSCAACLGPQLGYRNGTMYSSYTAASFPRIVDLAVRDKVNLDGILTWAFEFEDEPYFAGYRQLATNGIDLPVLNVFRIFSKMHGDKIAAISSNEIPLDEVLAKGITERPDVGVLAARSDADVTIMLWHYFDDDTMGPSAHISVDVKALPFASARSVKVVEYRIDDQHSNAYVIWQKMGSPSTPTADQIKELKARAGLEIKGQPRWIHTNEGGISLMLDLPRQGVSLLVVTPGH